MSAFLILGHGTENPIHFEKRNKIPEGITLVTLAKCGLVTYQRQICQAINLFQQDKNKEYLLDPKTHRKNLNEYMNDALHVYKEGDLYPSLEVQLFSNFLDKGENGWGMTLRLFKSGVYEFPAKVNDFTIYTGKSLGEGFCDRMYAFTDVDSSNTLPETFKLEPVYRGSIFPTPEEAERVRTETNGKIDTMKKKLTYSLEDIFKRGGPGVYYYFVCRSPKQIPRIYNYVSEKFPSENVKKFKQFNTPNWISGQETFMPMLESLLTKQKQNSWLAEQLRENIPKYQELAMIPKIRRSSIAQQQKKQQVNITGAGAGAGETPQNTTTKGGAKTRRKKNRKTRRRH